MKIWVQTLVKNEAKWLWYSVSSVIDHVDKVLLWDTGSTDSSIEIEKDLGKKYPEKIELRQTKQVTPEEFTQVRQEMLEETKSDWFIVLDGDEIWYDDSIKKVVEEISSENNKFESIVVPTINLIGDIFHFQEKSAGKYKFGDRVGHYNLRAVKRNISGLHSQGIHGVWGWADKEGKMIQDRNTYKFINAPYFHATNLIRSPKDSDVVKRMKKHRFEIGETFTDDYFYPEVFFKDRPGYIECPWRVVSPWYKYRAFFETPMRKIKRRLFSGKIGY